MGIVLDKFAKTEKKEKSAVKQAITSFFGSKKTVPVHIKIDQTFNTLTRGRNLKIIDNMKLNGIVESSASHQDDSVKTPPIIRWNFEDEYKSYIQKSIKRKSESDNVSYKRKLRKIGKEQSDLHDSLVFDIAIDKTKTSPNISKKDFSENSNKLLMNGTVSLKGSPKMDSSIQIDSDKSLRIQNTRAKVGTRSRSNSTNSSNNKKLKNLQLMQPTNQPVVLLDQTIVAEYLKAKKIIDRIMRPDIAKNQFIKKT